MNFKRAFTIIEMIVIIGSLAFVFIIVSQILMNSVKSSRKMTKSNGVEEGGSWVIAEIRKNLLKADVYSLSCPTGVGSSVTFVSRIDGQETSIVCDENEGLIASVSAGRSVSFLTDEVKVSGCDSFVSCDLDSPIPVVDFSFNLSIGDRSRGVDDYASRDFDAKVVIRE